MAMVTLVRCEKCKKWFEESELIDGSLCEICKKKEEAKSASAGQFGGDIKDQFLRYIERSGATSLTTLAKKYKNKVTEEEAEQALIDLETEQKITKRESKNKKGKYVYEIVVRTDSNEQ